VADVVGKIAIAEGQSQASTAAVKASSTIKEMYAGLKANNDPSTYKDVYNKTVESLKDFSPESKIGQKSYNEFLERSMPQWESTVEIEGLQKTQANIEADYITNWSSAVAQKDLALSEELTNIAESTGVLTPQEAANQRLKGQASIEKAIKGDSIESIKPLLVEAVTLGEKQDGLDVIGGSLNNLVKNGVLNKAEAAEADKILGDWLDNYTSGRKQKAKAAIRKTTTESYEEMLPLLIDPSVAQERYQMVESSKMPKDAKEEWNKYIQGSYKEPPEATTRDGKQVANNAVYDANTLVLSPTEAYDVLMEARFIDRTITNEQYERSIERIQNPYPADTNEALRSASKRINDSIQNKGPNYYTSQKDKERIVKAIDALEAWVSRQIGLGNYPTQEDIYLETRRLGATIQIPDEITTSHEPRTAFPPIPEKADPTYVTTDEQYDNIDPGSLFYDAINNAWRIKPQVEQPVPVGGGLKYEIY